MSYKISSYTFTQAKSMGLNVKPSKIKGKKIDIYRGDTKLASVGAIGYNDYPTYLEMESKNEVPKGTAEMKRKAYKARHIHRNKRGTPAWYADKLLW